MRTPHSELPRGGALRPKERLRSGRAKLGQKGWRMTLREARVQKHQTDLEKRW